jgi:hypothetical protein
LFGLLFASLVIATSVRIAWYRQRQAELVAVASEVVGRMASNADVIQLLGRPIEVKSGIAGEVKEDKSGWKQARLTIPVHGPIGDATVRVIGVRSAGSWAFTTFEIDVDQQHTKLDIWSGGTAEADSDKYVDVHTQPSIPPEYRHAAVTPPSLDGQFPCVFAALDQTDVVPQLGRCPVLRPNDSAVDRIETDLRYGNLRLQQTDLRLDDVFKAPLTRSYNSRDWVHPNRVHAFGRNTNHPFDVAPVGTRNPYTYQLIVLETGDFLFFDRISTGTGYADAVYQHTETATKFYKATHSWNGTGWTTLLADGSEIRFPESYNATNMAQGAPTEMRDALGNSLQLRRNGKRELQEISTPHGHWIRFVYDRLSRIVWAADDAGNAARYIYNPRGMLADVIFSSGRERHYEYDGALMTQIADERGHVLVRNFYNGPALVRQDFGNRQVYSYRYDGASSRRYIEKVAVRLPDGSRQVVATANDVPDYDKNPRK